MRLFSLSSLFCLLWSEVALAATLKPIPRSSVQQRVEPCSIDGLQHMLSEQASISLNISEYPRYSDYHAPQPGAVVNVATEKDVQVTVQYCLKNGIPFLAQNGAHGWIGTFHLEQNGVIINLRGLNFTIVSSDKQSARIGGGVLVQEVIDKAYESDVQILTGNCNCVGVLGAGLGGGYGNLAGMYGLSVDNMLALNVVLANGSAVTVTPADTDLWWALRGAGPNFGIVTSAVMKAYPMPKEQNMAWVGGLFFSEDKLEQLVQAVQDLHLEPNMVIFFLFGTTGKPDFTPAIFVTIWYFGSEADGRIAFKSILDLEPYLNTMAMLPYNKWNAGSDGFCTKGGRKPVYSAGFSTLQPSTMRTVWNSYNEFLKNPGAGYSAMLIETYSREKIQSASIASASFPNRDVRYNGIMIPWYYDASLDAAAETFGTYVRDLWRSTDGFSQNRTYVNFGSGDEDNSVVYNDHTDRLRSLKKQYDPQNVFNQWFNLGS